MAKAATTKTPAKQRKGKQEPQMDWPADAIERRATSDLVPYARNPRVHSLDQVEDIAKSIQEFGFTVPILIDERGEVIAGHGRLLAAEALQLETVPVVVAKGWSEERKRAYRIADNQLTFLGDWDDDALAEELEALADSDIGLDLTFLEEDVIKDLLDEAMDDGTPAPGSGGGLPEISGAGGEPDSEGVDDSTYSRKIEAPVYEPSPDGSPPVESLMDESRTRELVAEIDAADLPDDVAAFLRAAAQRHTVFDFRRIADFYAHAPAETQRLMERSALVIIDFDKAIENGFVRLSERLMDIVGREYPEDG